MRKRTKSDLAWAAGLFEGEGCATVNKYKSGNGGRPTMQLQMTDEDVVRKFHAVIGMGKVYGPYRPSGHKEVWRWYVDGFEAVQAIAAMFWFYLGSRRKAKLRTVLEARPVPVKREKIQSAFEG